MPKTNIFLASLVLGLTPVAPLPAQENQLKYPIYSNTETLIPLDHRVFFETYFGNFEVPLANVADRTKFYTLDAIGNVKDHVKPDRDGRYKLAKMTLAFWMPDGSGVTTNPSHLTARRAFDPKSRTWRDSAPLRPVELGHPVVDPASYVVVINAFCPHGRTAPQTSLFVPFENHLIGTGYGYGAFDMFSCKENIPPKEWLAVEGLDDGFAFYCRIGESHCFGWVDLPNDRVKALTFLPRDAVSDLPRVQTRLIEALKKWKAP